MNHIGVGIDTARYGHRVQFLREDRQLAARPFTVTENRHGYDSLEKRLRELHVRFVDAVFHVHIDAAGQYAANLEVFLRKLDLPLQISVGEPKRNKDYQKAFFAKRTTDDTESMAMARFGVVEQPAATAELPVEFQILREITSRLESQVRDTTRTKNRLHNLLSRVFPELDLLGINACSTAIRTLLKKYPTPERLANARLASVKRIPYLRGDLAETLHAAAKQSIGSIRGVFAEKLIVHVVEQLDTELNQQDSLENMLALAYEALPHTGHCQITTIPGIGMATAAVLVAKVVSISRFKTPENLVGYFGVFPGENSSGVDKNGRPLPSGTQRMSPRGSDIVRRYLWNAAKSGIQHNPAVRALYARLTAKGVRGDVALGHCMRKLLHQVFGVWSSNQPYDEAKSFGPVRDPGAEGCSQEASPTSTAGIQACNSLSSNVPVVRNDSFDPATVDKHSKQKGPLAEPKDLLRESSRHDSAIPHRVARQQSSTPIHRASEILPDRHSLIQQESFCHAIPQKTHPDPTKIINHNKKSRRKTSGQPTHSDAPD